MAYDIETNTWSHLKPTGTAPPPANTNAAFYEYDARLEVVVANYNRAKLIEVGGDHRLADPEPQSAM
jgi:hypothetical protein